MKLKMGQGKPFGLVVNERTQNPSLSLRTWVQIPASPKNYMEKMYHLMAEKTKIIKTSTRGKSHQIFLKVKNGSAKL